MYVSKVQTPPSHTHTQSHTRRELPALRTFTDQENHCTKFTVYLHVSVATRQPPLSARKCIMQHYFGNRYLVHMYSVTLDTHSTTWLAHMVYEAKRDCP